MEKHAQFHRAEKVNEGMALKICTKAEDIPDDLFSIMILFQICGRIKFLDRIVGCG